MLRITTDPLRRSLLAAVTYPFDFSRVFEGVTTIDVSRKKVAADVAYHVAKTHLGIVVLPTDIDYCIDQAVLNAGLKGRRLRLYGQRMLSHYRNLAMNQATGGIFGWNEPAKRRIKQRHKRDLRVWIRAVGTTNLSAVMSGEAELESEQLMPLPEKTDSLVIRDADDPGVLVETLAPSYETMTAAAFSATKFPGCYAAAVRIFKELRLRLPSFRPTRMLDFGSGLGTAIWAAHEVWETEPRDILAVERSFAMTTISREIEQTRRRSQRFPSQCIIKRIPQLPLLHGSSRRTRQRYNFVVCSYVLCELASSQERRHYIHQLWRNCSDTLVFIEPGTPVGSANIQANNEARTMVLDLERKRERKRRASQQRAADSNRAVIPLVDDWSIGAHIVSPCPHDDVCPMAEKNMWCHFSQRFKRTRSLKVTKLIPGHKWGPLDFQDEHFSYVVLKRGWREVTWGDAWEDVEISPHFYHQIKPDDAATEWTPNKDKRIEKEYTFFRGNEDEAEVQSAITAQPYKKLTGGRLALTTSSNKDRASLRAVPNLRPIPTQIDVKYPESVGQIKRADWSVIDPEGLENTRLASNRWSRIVRNPRKRTGHVILDVCTSCTSTVNGTCKGKLQRHTVAKSDKTRDVGNAGYAMARKAKWGDLWPTYYNINHKIIDV